MTTTTTFHSRSTISTTKNLAKAASQRLKGVIVDYDVLCSALGSKTSTHNTKDSSSTHSKHSSSSEETKNIASSPSVMDRIQASFGSLPSHLQARVPFLKKPVATEKTIKQEDKCSSKRDKYLDKLNALKKKHKGRNTSTNDVTSSSSSTLPTWRVNNGANVFIDTLNLRGISLVVIPTFSDRLRVKEYQEFTESMSSRGDISIIPLSDNLQSLTDICNTVIECEARDVMPIAVFNETIKNARAASCMTCRYGTSINQAPIRTDYRISHLEEFNTAIIEELNGISYRSNNPPKLKKYY